MNQEFVGGSSFEVGSLDLLEVRLLSLLLLVLVSSGEVGLWGMSDVLRSPEKLDVRILSWRVGSDTFGLWGLGCLLGGVLGIGLEASATWNVVRDVVDNNLSCRLGLFCPLSDLGLSVFRCCRSARIGVAHSMQTHAPHL